MTIPYQNIGEMFLKKLDECTEKPFLLFPNQHQTLTYKQTAKILSQLQQWFETLGIHTGNRVNLISANTPEFVLVYLACLLSGITIVPINPDLTIMEMSYITLDCGAKAILFHPSLAKKGVQLREKTEVKVAESIILKQIGDSSLNEISLSIQQVPRKQNDEAVIIYTSGTTGYPKGVILSHLNILSDAISVRDWFSFGQDVRTLCILPLFHNNGQVITLLAPLSAGGSTVVIDGRTGLLSAWEIIRCFKVNWTSVMPAMLNVWLSMPQATKKHAMIGIICGGQPLLSSVQSEFERRFGVPIFEGFGLTETTSFACFNDFPANRRRAGTVGRALPINEICIMDENGSIMPPNQEGEICIRGSNVTSGYLGHPEKNAVAFRNGWFHSGDYGFMDEYGYLHFITRKDFLIIKGGENIYPSEIENVISNQASVKICAAVGVPDKILGENICLFIELKEGIDPVSVDVFAFICKENLAKYKQPREIIIVNDVPELGHIPTGPTNKILYRKLKTYYEGQT